MNHDEVEVTVYSITGKQLFLRVSRELCEECDSTLGIVARAVDEFKNHKVKLVVRPWLNNPFSAVLKGAYHPPVVLVDGEVVSQGFVPSPEGVKAAIRLALEKRRRLNDAVQAASGRSL